MDCLLIFFLDKPIIKSYLKIWPCIKYVLYYKKKEPSLIHLYIIIIVLIFFEFCVIILELGYKINPEACGGVDQLVIQYPTSTLPNLVHKILLSLQTCWDNLYLKSSDNYAPNLQTFILEIFGQLYLNLDVSGLMLEV